MNKEQYFKISSEQQLPNRCPILQYCCRRAWTIYFLNQFNKSDPHNNYVLKLLQEGEISEDFQEKSIKMSGELPGGALGNISGWFHDLCPEVNLFDTMNSIGYFNGTACSSGSYDRDNTPEFKIYEEKHFSECAEFSNYIFDINNSKSNYVSVSKNSKIQICYTYLMVNKRSGYHKIGISNSLEKREKTLQSEEPDVELLAAKRFELRILAKNQEKELHLKYKHRRLRGEWFDLLDNEVVEILKELNAK